MDASEKASVKTETTDPNTDANSNVASVDGPTGQSKKEDKPVEEGDNVDNIDNQPGPSGLNSKSKKK